MKVLILNGRSVVDQFQAGADSPLDSEVMAGWTLPRRSRPDVVGVGYRGTVGTLYGVSLGRELLVLGFNHNIQGSFGVTGSVIRAIRDWIASNTSKATI